MRSVRREETQMISRYRETYERVSLPLGKLCTGLGITPNALTLTSVVIAGLAGWAIAVGHFVLGAVLILLAGVFDALDGATARAAGLASNFGTVLDHVADRYAEFVIFVGIYLSGEVRFFWAFVALFGMLMASYTRAKAESKGKVESCTVGIAERQEKLGLVMLGLVLEAVVPGRNLLELSVIIVAIISHITVVQRLAYAKRHSPTD